MEEILRSSEEVIISSRSNPISIDGGLIKELRRRGYESSSGYVVQDVSGGWFLDDLPTLVLIEMNQQERVFENRGKRFRVEERYGVHSTRYFVAVKE